MPDFAYRIFCNDFWWYCIIVFLCFLTLSSCILIVWNIFKVTVFLHRGTNVFYFYFELSTLLINDICLEKPTDQLTVCFCFVALLLTHALFLIRLSNEIVLVCETISYETKKCDCPSYSFSEQGLTLNLQYKWFYWNFLSNTYILYIIYIYILYVYIYTLLYNNNIW